MVISYEDRMVALMETPGSHPQETDAFSGSRF